MSTIETHTFRLAPGVDDQAFVDLDARLQTEFFYQQPGLLRRTTARGADGDWLVVLLYDSERDAEAANEAANGHPLAMQFASLIDPASYGVARYTTLD